MARNDSRSLNGDLAEGMTDGKYKKIAMDRGGEVGQATWRERMHLDDIWHGLHEVKTKILPDTTVKSTPDYVNNPLPDRTRD